MGTPQNDLVAKIGKTAYEYERVYHGCSQCVLAALQDGFKLGGQESFKAATALAGGIARLGNACGALTGGLMAISLAFGRDRLEDSATSKGYARAMDLSGELCKRFETEYGSTLCRDVQQRIFGRSFNLRDPSERVAFWKVGAHEKCAQVVQRAAELATQVILEAGFTPQGQP